MDELQRKPTTSYSTPEPTSHWSVRYQTTSALSGNILRQEATNLANFSGIVGRLKKERAQVERQLRGIDAAIKAFANVYSGAKPGRQRRKMSAKGRARIAAAQRARWAKVKEQQTASKLGKRAMSASARRKIAAAQRARWAKVRREKKAA
jgi:hypothetical protein